MKHNATDKKKIEEKKQAYKNEHDQIMNDCKAVLNTPEGYRYFKHFFKRGALLGTSMTGNSWTYFREGQRDAVNKVWEEIAASDETVASKLFIELTKEGKQDTENERKKR